MDNLNGSTFFYTPCIANDLCLALSISAVLRGISGTQAARGSYDINLGYYM